MRRELVRIIENELKNMTEGPQEIQKPMKKKEEELCNFYVRNFPLRLRCQLSAYSRLRGGSIRRELTRMVEDELRDYSESVGKKS